MVHRPEECPCCVVRQKFEAAAHVRAASGAGGNGAVIAAKAEVAEAAALEAVALAAAVVELRSGAGQEAGAAAHLLVWGAQLRLHQSCRHA